MIAVSDSNHNRILILDLNGKIKQIIGDRAEGLQDGDFDKARFFRPQGVLWKDDKLYVSLIQKTMLCAKLTSTARL